MAAVPQQPLGEDPAWLAALESARSAAVWPWPVVVQGETGTGKELVAQAYHDASERKGRLVKVNCGAIPHNMIEFALFGYVKGAYTGAHSDSPGHFRAAEGGTLFLDEIGELPLDAQVKLLRVLQDSVIMPVGTSTAVPVDVRVIVATHRDLPAMVAAGTFREDLWYRLRALRIEVPPLRERRPSDIDLLARAFLADDRRDFSPTDFDRPALAALRAHDWPGNVRELQAVIRSALVAHGARPGMITAADLGLVQDAPVRLETDYASFVERLGFRAAARELGISQGTLSRRLRGVKPRGAQAEHKRSTRPAPNPA